MRKTPEQILLESFLNKGENIGMGFREKEEANNW